MKTCTKCGCTKPLSDFHKYAQSKDGHKPACKQCNTAAAVAYQSANTGSRKTKDARYRTKNLEAVRISSLAYAHSNAGKEKSKAWRSANKQANKVRHNLWVQENKDRDREHKRNWMQRNKAYMLAKVRHRQMVARRAEPIWADKNTIEFFYATRQYMTQETGYAWHVDHIVPLQGDSVCGLHVHFNLRVIPAVDNLRKGNKFSTQE